MSHTKKTVFSAIMVSVGILLPLVFHAIPNAGAIFAPMHLPVLVAGFICGPLYGILVGLICPLLSFIMTGMPNAAYLPNMMVELFFYGGCTGLFFRLIKTRFLVLDIFLSLIVSLLIGRIMGGFVAYMLFLGGRRDSYSWTIFFTTYFVTCWPALIIQLATVPTVVGIARKVRFFTEADRHLDPNYHKKQIAKQSVFFDNLAADWRVKETLSDGQIDSLIGDAGIVEGSFVLDVACGNGVLDGYLSDKGCKVDAIDISRQMILKAQANPRNANVNYSVADFYEYTSAEKYDFILLFDAYPHFKDKISFAEKAYSLLKDGGALWIFFDECKEKINGYHSGGAKDISKALLSAEEEAKLFKRKFEIIECSDNENGFRLGLKKKPYKPLINLEKIKK